MDSRLIFLHRLRRFDPHACGFPRQILLLDMEVGRVVRRELEAALLPKSVAEDPRKAHGVRSSRPY